MWGRSWFVERKLCFEGQIVTVEIAFDTFAISGLVHAINKQCRMHNTRTPQLIAVSVSYNFISDTPLCHGLANNAMFLVAPGVTLREQTQYLN